MIYKPNVISPHSVSVDAECIIFEIRVEGRLCTGVQLQYYTGTEDTWDGWENLGDKLSLLKNNGDYIRIAVLPEGAEYAGDTEIDCEINSATFFENGESYKWRANLYETKLVSGEAYTQIGGIHISAEEGTEPKTTSTYAPGFSSDQKTLYFQIRPNNASSASGSAYIRGTRAYENYTFLSQYPSLTNYYVLADDGTYAAITEAKFNNGYNSASPKWVDLTAEWLEYFRQTYTAYISSGNAIYYEQVSRTLENGIYYANYCAPVYVQGATQPDIYVAYGAMGLEEAKSGYSFTGDELTIQYSALVRDDMCIFFPDSDLGYLPFTVVSKNIQDATMVIKLKGGSITLAGDESSATYKIYSDFISTDECYFTCEAAAELSLSVSDESINYAFQSVGGKLCRMLSGKSYISLVNLSFVSDDAYIIRAGLEVYEIESGLRVYESSVFSANPSFSVDGFVFGLGYTLKAWALDSLGRTYSCEKNVVKASSISAISPEALSANEDDGSLTVTNQGGNSSTTNSRFYRMRNSFPYWWTYMGQTENRAALTDYAVGNREDVRYSVLSLCEDDDGNESVSGAVGYTYLSENSESSLFTLWDCYFLYGLDETDGECTVSEIWRFEIDSEEGAVTHSYGFEALETLSPLPKISRDETDYLKGSLKCGLGYISCDGIYYDSAEMLRKWRKFCAEHEKCLYKDVKGNVYIVAISSNSWQNSAIVHNMDGSAVFPSQISFEWTEIGRVDEYVIHG